MSDPQQRINDYNRKRQEADAAVLAGKAEAPPCFTCKEPSTHVTDGITPAGYRAYQCDKHVPKTRRPLWGGDSGWRNDYVPLPATKRSERP